MATQYRNAFYERSLTNLIIIRLQKANEGDVTKYTNTERQQNQNRSTRVMDRKPVHKIQLPQKDKNHKNDVSKRYIKQWNVEMDNTIKRRYNPP